MFYLGRRSHTDTMTHSYLGMSSACAASAAESAVKRKKDNVIEISRNYHLFPIAFETSGPINQIGMDFISALGHRISSTTDDPRETFCLFQRLSVAIQHFNADVYRPLSAILMLKCDATRRDTFSS